MKIRFILCHPAHALFSEEREIHLADALWRQGHDAAYFAISNRDLRESRRHAEFSCPVEMFPRDDPAVSPHQSTSAALLQVLAADDPDLMMVKGIDYRQAALIFEKFPRDRLGVIIGGRGSHPLLDAAGLIYFETEAQRDAYSGQARTAILPKYIKWEELDSLDARDKPYDVINIGNFHERRKAQEFLFPLAHRHKLIFVGGGPRLESFRSIAAGNGNITFTGFVPRRRVFELLKASRLMVHASIWDGFPRVVAESLAAGVPVVGVEGVLDRITPEPFIRTAPVEQLNSVAAQMLAEGDRLLELGERARRYMVEHSGYESLLAAFCAPLPLSDRRQEIPAPMRSSVAGSPPRLDAEFRKRPDLGNIMEVLIARLYAKYVKTGDWVVDAGADAGLHTLPLAKLVGETGRVLAYEPRSTENLIRSLAAHGLRNVVVRQAALSSMSGVAPFYRNTKRLALSSLVRPSDMTGHVEEVTEVLCLDEAQIEGRLTFIKLDVEGAEFDCLKGAQRLLEKHAPLIVLENGREATARRFGYTAAEFFALFARFGYRLADVFGRPLEPDTWRDPSLVWYFVATTAPAQLEEVAGIAGKLLGEIKENDVRLATWRDTVRAVGDFGVPSPAG